VTGYDPEAPRQPEVEQLFFGLSALLIEQGSADAQNFDRLYTSVNTEVGVAEISSYGTSSYMEHDLPMHPVTAEQHRELLREGKGFLTVDMGDTHFVIFRPAAMREASLAHPGLLRHVPEIFEPDRRDQVNVVRYDNPFTPEERTTAHPDLTDLPELQAVLYSMPANDPEATGLTPEVEQAHGTLTDALVTRGVWSDEFGDDALYLRVPTEHGEATVSSYGSNAYINHDQSPVPNTPQLHLSVLGQGKGYLTVSLGETTYTVVRPSDVEPRSFGYAGLMTTEGAPEIFADPAKASEPQVFQLITTPEGQQASVHDSLSEVPELEAVIDALQAY
jgi:hypothetical protein